MKKNQDNNIWKVWLPKKLDEKLSLMNISNIEKSPQSLHNTTLTYKNNSKSKYSEIYYQGYYKGLKEGYQKGYQTGWLQCFSFSKNFFLENYRLYVYLQYSDLLKKFRSAIYYFNKSFSKRVMNIVLSISKIVVNDIYMKNKNYIVKKIKSLMQHSRYIFQKLQLHVHPNNYHIIKKKFGTLMNSYGWTIILNKKVDVNGYRVITKEGEVDSTSHSFWNQVNNISNLSD